MTKLSKLEISARAFEVFKTDFEKPPAISLRSGNNIDGYSKPIPYDEQLDKPTDEFLEEYHCGITFLDPASWRHYVPTLIDLSIRKMNGGSLNAVDSFLASLWPPDREPPRFGSLTDEQESVIISFLDLMAFDEESEYREDAMRVIEEYWGPGANSP